MVTNEIVPAYRSPAASGPGQYVPRMRRGGQGIFPMQYRAEEGSEDQSQRQAELFYLQKQIQSQTPMVIVLEDGEHIEGNIEWYDRHSIKVRGRAKSLIYKSAIKYMYKLGDGGQ